mmetsp:Transcript_37541/g.82340  ORF Transcript_37541/g.82340 Transcript_37541/m.82340 type:complete len:129 (+) Transcript_37541:3615-4001(+)
MLIAVRTGSCSAVRQLIEASWLRFGTDPGGPSCLRRSQTWPAANNEAACSCLMKTVAPWRWDTIPMRGPSALWHVCRMATRGWQYTEICLGVEGGIVAQKESARSDGGGGTLVALRALQLRIVPSSRH